DRGDRSRVLVEGPGLQDAEHVALRVRHDRPRDVALSDVGGCRTELLQARDQFRLVRLGGGGGIEVGAVLHRFGVRDGDDINADRRGVRPIEPDGFDVGHAGTFARDAPAERVRPELAERLMVPGLVIDLHQLQRHGAEHRREGDRKPNTFSRAPAADPSEGAPRQRPRATVPARAPGTPPLTIDPFTPKSAPKSDVCWFGVSLAGGTSPREESAATVAAAGRDSMTTKMTHGSTSARARGMVTSGWLTFAGTLALVV